MIVMGVLFAVALCAIVFGYHMREKRMIKRLWKMLDEAAKGTFENQTLDETMLSALENRMKHFVEDCDAGKQNMADQKQKIQTLISDISHQTVTPISNILLYAQLLAEKEELAPYQAEMTAISEQAEKLDFLISSMVKASRMETGIITVHPKENPLQDVFDEVEIQLRQRAFEKKIELTFEATKEKAFFDKKWLIEAVCNVVDNAVKYTKCGGRVTVRITAYTVFLRIDVEDNGIGIAEEEHSKIFLRFYRSPQVSEEKGVGIGLYLTREIVSLQGGYMKVISEPGQGSTFSVFLPREKYQKCDISETGSKH